jgi:hypothetical protein
MWVVTEDPKELLKHVVEVIDEWDAELPSVHDSEECEKELKEWIKHEIEKIHQLM